eukprot:scaffold153804_cov55-Cyclotella_meneghiniana.AAC.2
MTRRQQNTASKYRAKPPRFGVENEEVFSRYLARYFSNRRQQPHQPRNNRCRNNDGTPHRHCRPQPAIHPTQLARKLTFQLPLWLQRLVAEATISYIALERNVFGFGFRPLFRHGPPLLSLAPPASTSALIGGYKYRDSTCLRDCSGSRHPRIVTATTNNKVFGLFGCRLSVLPHGLTRRRR